ncbi:hypothetical protein ACFPOE_22190 [Caenimonas terrae]|uniref:L,D-transpeptidase n=1 Tax=Caenimonas terrae TaxID=696074 RepID=A0ABW0NKL3_9BURK
MGKLLRAAIGGLAAGLVMLLARGAVAPVLAAQEEHVPRRADFGHERPGPDVRHIADWALDSGDNAGLPFVVVDKVHARVFVFAGNGRLLGASPVLVGLTPGDDAVPGIGARQLSTIQPAERTTPAGRFAAALNKSLAGEEILWVDYDSGVALHRVIATVPKERRLQRLQSALPQEHRITFGCINVPVKFFDKVVSPAFTGTSGIVYVLPETRPVRDVFGSYDVGPGPGPAAGRQGGSEAAPSR